MRILIATGSSGGHIFPALALAEALKSSGKDVLLVLPQKKFQNNIPFVWEPVKYLPAANLSLNLNSKNIVNFYIFLKGVWKSLRIILGFKPDLVVGFGSLNTVALIFWAWFFRIKTLIHEQNVICGRANKVLAKLVDKVAISFSQTKKSLNISSEKIVLTGNPLRKDLVRLNKQEAQDFFKFKKDKFTILIIGGSQGAHKLNAVCLEALVALGKNDNLQIIHICGALDYNWLKNIYASSNLSYKLFDFFPQMQYAYSAADLIISRAGATTIAELQKFRIPALLVPYPFAYAHQLANAQILNNIGAAQIFPDADLNASQLMNKLQEYLSLPEEIIAMQMAYQKLPVLDSTALLANAVLSLS